MRTPSIGALSFGLDGLVPKQNSSGGREKLTNISKAGNRYLRQMLVVGAMAVIRYAERNGTRAMACATDGAANVQGCSGCTRQQDRPDGLGIDDERRTLQGAGRRIERDKARVADEVGKGGQELMHKAG